MTTQTYFSRKSTRKREINYYFEIKYFSNILCYRRKIAKASKTGGLQYRAVELNKSKGWTKSVQISEQCVALTHNHYLHLHNVQFVPSRMSGPIHFRVLYSVYKAGLEIRSFALRSFSRENRSFSLKK